jgi:hypothetical protein
VKTTNALAKTLSLERTATATAAAAAVAAMVVSILSDFTVNKQRNITGLDGFVLLVCDEQHPSIHRKKV